jgi:hypothetical protein
MAKKTTGEIVTDLLYNKWFWVIVLLVIIIWYVYNEGKDDGQGDQSKLPNSGSGIPVGWTPNPAAITIHNAMDTGAAFWGAWGYGTDEDLIFSTLEPLTLDQRVAVNNEFNKLYQNESGMSMADWFESELDGEDLSRVMALFNGASI